MFRLIAVEIFFVALVIVLVAFGVYLYLNNNPSFAGFLRWVRFRDEKVPQNKPDADETTSQATSASARTNESSSEAGK